MLIDYKSLFFVNHVMLIVYDIKTKSVFVHVTMPFGLET